MLSITGDAFALLKVIVTQNPEESGSVTTVRTLCTRLLAGTEIRNDGAARKEACDLLENRTRALKKIDNRPARLIVEILEDTIHQISRGCTFLEAGVVVPPIFQVGGICP